MPLQSRAVARVPAPFDLVPQVVDEASDLRFLRVFALEIFPRAQKTHDQERRLDQIAAIILAHERNRGAGASIHEVRKNAVIAGRARQQLQHAARCVQRPLRGVSIRVRLRRCAPSRRNRNRRWPPDHPSALRWWCSGPAQGRSPDGAASQKKPKVCRCTVSSNCLLGQRSEIRGLRALRSAHVNAPLPTSVRQAPAPGFSASLRWDPLSSAKPSKTCGVRRCGRCG